MQEASVSLLQLLKKATADSHRQVEDRVPIFQPDFDRGAYIALLERFYGYWCPLEKKLSRLPSLQHADLALPDRMKAGLLVRDLQYLGSDPARIPSCQHLPPIENFSQGLGALYVVEGSTLGARIISRHIGDRLNLTSDHGASFFNAYGERSGQYWTSFKTFVESNATLEQAGEIVIAANTTFRCFYDWLG